MTFRIDVVERRNTDQWCWQVKGLYGQGIHGILVTGADGDGLYLWELWEQTLILAPEAFAIPHGVQEAEANRLLAAALNSLGWGPQVDQRGNIVPGNQ